MNWRQIGRTSYATWRAVLTSVGAPEGLISRESYDAAGEHSALALAQLLIESAGGRSSLARDASNPLGLRPRTGGVEFVWFPSFPDAIRFWHGKITDPAYAYAPTETLAEYVHVYAPSSDNNNEATYVRDVETYVASWPREEEESPVPGYRTTIPGLPGGLLETDYPVRFNLIAVDGFQRSGRKAAKPRRSITHGTGNPNNASAWAEAQYFVNGAEGRQASIHACIDDHEVVVCLPLDEVAWQAGDGNGTGNLNGFACETMEATAIWNDPSRRAQLVAIAADFMGRCSARLGIRKAERHWDANWVQCCDSPCDVQCGNRHHCPDKLMDTGLWESSFVPQWQAARLDELRRMGGKPEYVKPDPPALDQHGRPYPHRDANGATWLIISPARWKALETTPRKQYAEDDAAEVGPPIEVGSVVTFAYSVAAPSGVWFVSKAGTRARADAFVAEVA